MKKFQDLNRLQQISIENKIAESHDKLEDDDFAEILQAAYEDSNVTSYSFDNFDVLSQVASFKIFALEQALSQIKSKKDHVKVI